MESTHRSRSPDRRENSSGNSKPIVKNEPASNSEHRDTYCPGIKYETEDDSDSYNPAKPSYDRHKHIKQV